MNLLTIFVIVVVAILALFGASAIVLFTFGYRFTVDPLAYPDWAAIGALGQLSGVIVSIIMPIVVFFIGERIKESVDNASKKTVNAIKRTAYQNNISNTTMYCSTSTQGTVIFDYSNNNGIYRIGENYFMFEIAFSKASNQQIYIYNDPNSIATVALVNDVLIIKSISNAGIYDTSSRTRCPAINQIVILQNINNFYAAIKILSIQDDSRGASNDEVVFEYVIQTNGSPDFTTT